MNDLHEMTVSLPVAAPALSAADRGFVYAVARRIVRSANDADDVTQDAMILAYRYRASFRGESKYRTWLYRIAVNESVGQLRKRRDPQELEDDSRPVADGAAAVVEQIAVQAALGRTCPAHRTVLVLRFWEGLTYEEMADVLGLSLGAVKMRLHRAREAFRKQYDEDLG